MSTKLVNMLGCCGKLLVLYLMSAKVSLLLYISAVEIFEQILQQNGNCTCLIYFILNDCKLERTHAERKPGPNYLMLLT